MQIKFSVVIDDMCQQHQEHTINSFDFRGVIEDFEKVIELRSLRDQVHKLKSAALSGSPGESDK